LGGRSIGPFGVATPHYGIGPGSIDRHSDRFSLREDDVTEVLSQKAQLSNERPVRQGPVWGEGAGRKTQLSLFYYQLRANK
jgi:hypothetical protein